MALPERLVVGVDLGTSGARAIAFDQELRSVARASRSYSVTFAAGGVAEQPVMDVVEAGAACIGAVAAHPDVARNIQAIAFCSTASSLAAFRAGQPSNGDPTASRFAPATPAWLWADGRAAGEARRVAQQFGMEGYRRTGCPVHASYWPAKLLWWRAHALGPFAENAGAPAEWRLAGQKDYLIYRLTGEWVTDRATAAATGLFASEQGQWDTELLDWLGIDRSWLPRIVPITEQLPLLPAAAERLSLAPDTRIVAGALDGVLTHLGMGCAHAGLASCTIGSSSAMRMSSPQRVTDAKSRTWCYPVVDDLWLIGGAGNNGGNVLTWFQMLCSDMARLGQNPQAAGGAAGGTDGEWAITMEQIIELAMHVAPGAEGLSFVPYLFGERSPLWREDLTGAFVGLAPIDRLPHLARAVLEGISLGTNGIYQALVDQRGPSQEVRAGGGFVVAPDWVQLQADILGVPIAVTATGQETATGAAILAWHAVHAMPLGELQDAVAVTQRFTPRPELHEQYQLLFARLQTLVNSLNGPIAL